MGVRDEVKKVGKGAAGIAAATAGLSTCHDGGGFVIDPPPPPLVCSTVSDGQTLTMSGRREANVLIVNIRPGGAAITRWEITRVGDAVGAGLLSYTVPASSHDSLVVSLQLDTPGTTQVDFTVEATMTGYRSETCMVRRVVHVTIGETGVQVAQSNLDSLPLPSRQGAQIAMLGRENEAVLLEVRTGYPGTYATTWEVTGGSLDATTGNAVRWTLPRASGIYQAEVLVDYGPAGMAFDAFAVEVRRTT